MNTRGDMGIYLLCLATFVTFLSAKLIAPILPILAAQLGAEDLSLASVSGAYVVFLALFQIFTGAFADRFGRRRTIALGSSIAAFSSLLCVFARSWEQLLILRAFGGAADAFTGPALLALVAELSGTRKGKAMGVFRSSQGLSLIIGPMIGGGIAYFFSVYAPFFADFALTLLGIALFLLLVPEARRRREASPPLQSLKFIARDLGLMKVAFLGFTETFAFAALTSFLPALAVELHMTEIEIATLFTAEAASFTLTNIVVGVLSDKVGRKPLMLIGLLSSAVDLTAFFFARDYWQILLLMTFYGFGSSSVYIMSSTMAVDILPEENRAMLFGAFDAFMDLGLVIGPAFCFTILAISGWTINSSFPLMAIPSLMAFGLIFSLKETKA